MQDAAALAGHLVASGKEETLQVEQFKGELATALSSGNYLVNRRETPFISSQTPLSAPAWVTGRQVARTAGPFRDELGRLYWYDFYRIKRQMKVARQTAANVFLSVPIDDTLLAFELRQTLHLSEGSIWCIAGQLTGDAPAGSFAGLTIASGRISFRGSFTLSGDTIVIGALDPCHLELELAQPAVTADSSSATGDDAKAMDLQLPETLIVDGLPGRVVFSSAGSMSLTLYNNKYKLIHAAARPLRFDTVVNRIFIPFDNDKTSVDVLQCLSPFVRLERSAPLAESAWALQVTQAAGFDQLGDAAGIGAIALLTSPGIKISWKGLERGVIALDKTWMLAAPGRIAITAPAALSGTNRQQYNGWQFPQRGDNTVFSRATLDYPKQFSLLYNSLATAAEALLMASLQLTLAIDRPVLADRKRPSVNTDRAAALLFQLKDTPYCYIQATGILQRLLELGRIDSLHPVAFALSNALIKTTPVDEAYLLAIVDADGRALVKGALKLVMHIYQLLPSLPDPYVSSYSLPVNQAYNRKELYSRGTYSGIDLYALVIWTDQKTVTTSLGFSRATAIPGAAAAAYIPVTPPAPPTTVAAGADKGLVTKAYIATNPIAIIRQEDAANSQGLISHFEKTFAARTSANIYLLDVSTNADLMGVGLGFYNYGQKQEPQLAGDLPFSIRGMDLATLAINTKVYTLPQIQWEPIRTIQNPDVAPYPFPSPATSPDTGIPTQMAIESYDLVPIAPLPVIDKLITSYNADATPARVAGMFNLPFGMKASALWDNAKDLTRPGASIALNQPGFEATRTTGGMQIAIIARSPDIGDDFETPGFKGTTIQTRNLIDLLTGTIPVDGDGNPLSVLGPVVDTIFNGEFGPSGAASRVPVERVDISGYGASMFSNWLNPNAVIAATSQARFDVWIGRTSHQIIQVKSILYPWGVPVVRTITIQRTSGGGVTRYDSGWKAQGPGKYDFSYYTMSGSVKTRVDNPFEFHPGAIKLIDHVTSIKDTGRIYRKPGAVPTDDVIMQEVLFDADVLIEDVQTGATDGYVPSKGQRGFVQLSPYQKPVLPEQFHQLLQEEGPLGGPVDCVINVGVSGQPMRLLRVDVSSVDNMGGNYVFVSAGHGSIQLPREGSWNVVKRQENTSDIVTIDQDAGLPLIREGKLGLITTRPYRFADPADILQAASPDSDYGILHSTGTQKILFLRPTIARGDAHIKSSLQPYFADSFAIINSKGIFPDVSTTFPLGPATGADLQIIGAGKLKLVSGGNYKAPAGYTRDMLHSGNSRIYVDYSDAAGSGDTAELSYSFDSDAPTPWTAHSKNHSLVVDLEGLTSLVTVTTEFDAAYGKKPYMPNPKTKFGSILQPIVDMLSFLGGQDISQALAVSMSNLNTTSWQPKLQGILEIEIEFKVFPPPKVAKFEVKIAHAGLDGEPPIPPEPPEPEPLPVLILGCDIGLKAYFNMSPQSLTVTNRDGSAATSEELAKETADMISSGAELEIEGELHVLCFTITPNVAGVYFIGILGFTFGLDTHDGKSFGFKVAMGAEIRAGWPIVGEVSVMLAVGLEMEWSDAGSGVFAILIFKGEAELLGGIIVIGIHIEAKGGQEKEIGAGGVTETYAVCEVEFAVEVSLAFVIHFEIDETWQEKRQIS